jgi:hypothetical protein
VESALNIAAERTYNAARLRHRGYCGKAKKD